jgi:DNA repair exonuclease SbcCD ATPase subunit
MPSLADIHQFSYSPDFKDYRKWLELDGRLREDPSVRMTAAELGDIQFWPQVKEVFEKVLPDARAVRDTFISSLNDEVKNYESCIKEWEKKNKLLIFYKEALEKLTSMYLDSLSGMLSEVYRSVYQTDSKMVQLAMEDYRNKKVIRLRIINHVEGKDYIEDFQDEGGAAQIILGIIVAVYFIVSTGLPRIIFIDESLSALHTETLERFVTILGQFRDSLDFQFVIVSHDHVRIRNFLDKVYEVRDGEYFEVPVEEFVRRSLEEVV